MMWRRKIIRHIGCSHPRVIVHVTRDTSPTIRDEITDRVSYALENQEAPWTALVAAAGITFEFPECSWCRKAGA